MFEEMHAMNELFFCYTTCCLEGHQRVTMETKIVFVQC